MGNARGAVLVNHTSVAKCPNAKIKEKSVVRYKLKDRKYNTKDMKMFYFDPECIDKTMLGEKKWRKHIVEPELHSSHLVRSFCQVPHYIILIMDLLEF